MNHAPDTYGAVLFLMSFDGSYVGTVRTLGSPFVSTRFETPAMTTTATPSAYTHHPVVPWAQSPPPVCSFCAAVAEVPDRASWHTTGWAVGGQGKAAACPSCIREMASLAHLPAPLPSPYAAAPPVQVVRDRAPMVHVLKADQTPFRAVVRGEKTAELRKADRDFRVGDTLRLVERVSRATIDVTIGHVLAGGAYGLEPGYVMLSIVPAQATWAAEVAARLEEHREAAIGTDRYESLALIVAELRVFATSARMTYASPADPCALSERLMRLRPSFPDPRSPARVDLDVVIEALLHAAIFVTPAASQ